MNLIQFKQESATGTGVYSTAVTEKPAFGAYVLTDLQLNAPTTADFSKAWDALVADIIGQYGMILDQETSFLIGHVDESSMNVQVAIHFDDIQSALKYAIMNNLQVYSDEYGHIETPSSQAGTLTQKQTYADMKARAITERLYKSNG
jgi:hypothetical protein